MMLTLKLVPHALIWSASRACEPLASLYHAHAGQVVNGACGIHIIDAIHAAAYSHAADCNQNRQGI